MNAEGSRADLRLAIISALVNQASPHPLGRTAVMKLVYFLQILYNIPLGYDFRIYTYGPYDGQVLEDLRVAELKGAVKSCAVGYSIGTGYAITPGEEAESLIARNPSVSAFIPYVASVIAEFGNRSATDLEMASTIIFVDRTLALSGRTAKIAEVAQKVKEMKPRLDLDRILHEASNLKNANHIKSA